MLYRPRHDRTGLPDARRDHLGQGFEREYLHRVGFMAIGASNPTLRDTHEYILVFSKGTFKREKIVGRESTITKEEFLEFTKSVWGLFSESARKVGHPAPFPVELPYRLIQLYTYSDEVVLALKGEVR